MEKTLGGYTMEAVLTVVLFLVLHRIVARADQRKPMSDLRRECDRLAAKDTLIAIFAWTIMSSEGIALPDKAHEFAGKLVLIIVFSVFYIADYLLRHKFNFLK